MNLFIVYVGGKTKTSLIEVHDVHFSFGEKIEDTYDQLRSQWWGTPDSLHIDAWALINCIDQFNVLLKPEPSINNENKLFFVNLGGYDINEFTELHKNILVVAKDELTAKRSAKMKIRNWKLPHTDNLYSIDNCVNVNDVIKPHGLSIHLIYTQEPTPFTFICDYKPIRKP